MTGNPLEEAAYGAVAAEVAKRQVAVLAEMLEELQAYDRACLQHARRLCEVLLAEGKRAGNGAGAEALPNDLEGVMRRLEQLAGHALDEAALQRIRKDIEPNATVLRADADQVLGRLEESRFWLGLVQATELRTYVRAMADCFAALDPAASAVRSSVARFRELATGHPEAARAIAHLAAVSRGVDGSGGR